MDGPAARLALQRGRHHGTRRRVGAAVVRRPGDVERPAAAAQVEIETKIEAKLKALIVSRD